MDFREMAEKINYCPCESYSCVERCANQKDIEDALRAAYSQGYEKGMGDAENIAEKLWDCNKQEEGAIIALDIRDALRAFKSESNS